MGRQANINYKELAELVNKRGVTRRYKICKDNNDYCIIIKAWSGINKKISLKDGTAYYIKNGVWNRYTSGDKRSTRRTVISFSLWGNRNYHVHTYVLVIALGILIPIYDRIMDKELDELYCKSIEWYKKIWKDEPVEINHIDGNAVNNRPSNLEITSRYYNIKHSEIMQALDKYYPEIYTERYGRSTKNKNRPIKFRNGNKLTTGQIRFFESQIAQYNGMRGLLGEIKQCYYPKIKLKDKKVIDILIKSCGFI